MLVILEVAFTFTLCASVTIVINLQDQFWVVIWLKQVKLQNHSKTVKIIGIIYNNGICRNSFFFYYWVAVVMQTSPLWDYKSYSILFYSEVTWWDKQHYESNYRISTHFTNFGCMTYMQYTMYFIPLAQPMQVCLVIAVHFCMQPL